MIFKNTRYKNKHHMATQLLLNTAGVTGHLDEEILQVLYSAYRTTISRASVTHNHFHSELGEIVH